MLPEDLPVALWILLGAIAFLQILVWIGQLRLRARLSRIECRLTAAAAPSVEDPAESLREQKAGTQEQKRQFKLFLEEDPSRAELPKKEQFAAFRKWRSEQGLNWGGGDS